MASEDVIELGSSDDDAEPQPKKAKTVPNVMVHIPRKLPGVTIKPAKQKTSPVLEKLASKPITVTKIKNPNVNPFASKNRPVSKGDPKKFTPPMRMSNPLSKMGNPRFIYTKVSGTVSQVKQPVRLQRPIMINTLPPNITVKRNPAVTLKSMSTKKIRIEVPKKAHTVVSTVELDDDECPPASTNISPQWYLRPEEQTEKSTLEQENNKEPDKSKVIEITIEDSPVKPLHDKRKYEVGAELSITIDDSPVKPTPEKNASASGSEDEEKVEREHNSKKKLEYPKKTETDMVKTIEIELEPIVDPQNKDTSVYEKSDIDVSLHDDVIEIQEKSIKLNTSSMENLAKHVCKKIRPEKSVKSESVDLLQVKEKEDKEEREFHPIYQSFIDLCFKLEDSDDMKKIVEKKVKAYYRQVPKEYTESEAFIDMVSSKISSMKLGPEKMYLYIKDVVDELNLQRKMAKSQATIKAAVDTAGLEESNKFLYGEESEFDSKRQRQIRKLEKTLKKLHRAIQLLEEQEVDFDDEDDSVYLLTERYKERMVRVHAKFCQLTNTKMPSEPRVQIDARPGQPAGPAKRLEKWINRKVPIGTPLPFPDFHDVLRCVREANEEDRLGWNEADIMEEARDLFTRCGKKLQRRRQENEWRLAASRISVDEDPAEKNEELKKKLELNKHVAAKKEIEVFNKYADRQNLLNLEAEEIGDKEAEESPVESEEEEDNNDEGTSLLNKEKRKERLKRLLQDKSKRNVEKQEDQTMKINTKKADDEIVCRGDKKDETKEIRPYNKEKTDNEGQLLETVNDQNIELSQDKIHSLSDDSNLINSDIDELHLLEKLHSDKEVLSSTLESSDSETPIAISDTLSSGDNRKHASDVISIEDSSYSESEHGPNDVLDTDDNDVIVKSSTDYDIEVQNFEENASTKTEKCIKSTNNNEYNESVEDILLASSDEETMSNNIPMEEESCIGLDNDSVLFTEPIVECNKSPNKDGDERKRTLIIDAHQKKDVTKVHGTVEKDQVLTESDASLNNVLTPIETSLSERDKLLYESNIHSNEDSVSVVALVTETEQNVSKEDDNLEYLVTPLGSITDKEHSISDINTMKDASSDVELMITNDQVNTKNNTKIVKDLISNQETENYTEELHKKDINTSNDLKYEDSIPKNESVNNVETLDKKDSNTGNEFKSLKTPETEKPIEDAIESNTDVEIPDVISNKINSKDLDPLVGKMKTETHNDCNDDSIKAHIKNDSNNDVNNADAKNKSKGNESQLENCSMEVDEVTSNASQGVIV